MKRGLALVVTAALSLAAQPALACSRGYINPYAKVAKSPVTRLVTSAAYIDWVQIEIEGPPPCAPPKLLTPEAEGALDTAWEAWEAAPEPKPPPPEPLLPPRPLKTTEGQVTRTCNYTAQTGPIRPLKARVIESVKAGGSSYFSLAYRWDASNPWQAFTDPRTRLLEVQAGDEDLTARAIAKHRTQAFYDRGDFMWLKDGSDSCGGEKTAMIGERYMAFRDRYGSVLAIEAVRDRDDPWFDRVRRYAGTGKDYPPTLDVADFFRASKGVALIRLKSCKVDPDGWRFGATVRAEILRGSFSAGDFGRPTGRRT